MKIKFFSILLFSILLLNCNSPIRDYESFIAQSVNPIDNTRISQADSDDSNWLTYGKNFSETRFSTLDQV